MHSSLHIAHVFSSLEMPIPSYILIHCAAKVWSVSGFDNQRVTMVQLVNGIFF